MSPGVVHVAEKRPADGHGGANREDAAISLVVGEHGAERAVGGIDVGVGGGRVRQVEEVHGAGERTGEAEVDVAVGGESLGEERVEFEGVTVLDGGLVVQEHGVENDASRAAGGGHVPEGAAGVSFEGGDAEGGFELAVGGLEGIAQASLADREGAESFVA